MVEPHDLVGYKSGDAADVLACMHKRFIALPPGVSAYDWEAPSRQIPNPPSVEGAPFTEIRLAATPEGAWAGQILRRAASSEQPIWQILKDVRRYPIYRIEVPGARIKDCHSDSRMVGGPVALRKEGEETPVHEEDLALVTLGAPSPAGGHELREGTSVEWQALDRYFREPIVAVSLPDDSPHPTIRPDWPVVASIPRLDALEEGHMLKLIYVGERRMRLRDMLRLVDVTGKPAGLRFAYFLARESAHDFFSPRRKRSIRDWATLATAVASAGGIAGLISRLIDLLS